jgi:hypothetical protein
MADKTDKKTKRPYQKPAVIFAKNIEVISAVCDTARGGKLGCKKSAPGCSRLLT